MKGQQRKNENSSVTSPRRVLIGGFFHALVVLRYPTCHLHVALRALFCAHRGLWTILEEAFCEVEHARAVEKGPLKQSSLRLMAMINDNDKLID